MFVNVRSELTCCTTSSLLPRRRRRRGHGGLWGYRPSRFGCTTYCSRGRRGGFAMRVSSVFLLSQRSCGLLACLPGTGIVSASYTRITHKTPPLTYTISPPKLSISTPPKYTNMPPSLAGIYTSDPSARLVWSHVLFPHLLVPIS